MFTLCKERIRKDDWSEASLADRGQTPCPVNSNSPYTHFLGYVISQKS